MEDLSAPQQTLHLRLLQSADLDHFLELGCQTCGSLHGRPNQSKSDLFERFRGFVKDFAFRPESEIWVASTSDSSYVAHLWLYVSVNRFNGIKELWIWDVSVEAEFRGRGFGRQLMNHALQRSSEQDCEEVWLLVADDNPVARSLYASCGLKPRAHMMAL